MFYFSHGLIIFFKDTMLKNEGKYTLFGFDGLNSPQEAGTLFLNKF